MANQEQKNVLASKLKFYLDRKGITQTDLAKELNYPEMTVSNWVNAKFYPRIDKIQEMADFFGVNKSDLMEEKTEKYIDTFTTPEEAIIFLSSNQASMFSEGFDISKLSEEEQLEYANEVINMMNLVSLKYKGKNK